MKTAFPKREGSGGKDTRKRLGKGGRGDEEEEKGGRTEGKKESESM